MFAYFEKRGIRTMIHDLPKSLVEDSRKILEGSKEYQEFFKKTTKKFGVDSNSSGF